MKIFSLFSKKQTYKDLVVVFIEGFALIAIWRGTWNLMDMLVFPDDTFRSAVASVMLGLLLLKIVKVI